MTLEVPYARTHFGHKGWYGIGRYLTKLQKCSTMYYKGDDRMAFSIRLTEQEKQLAESYARLHAISLGEAFKRALFEKIEDEYDLTV